VIGTNDYPWPRANPDEFDQWGYNFRNCTSFCAWRIHNDLKLPVLPWGKGGAQGRLAAADGVLVDGHPRPGDLACFLPNRNGAGNQGHVAFVMSLSTGAGKITVNLEEYNFDHPFAYGQRLDVRPAGLQFIHYASAPTPPPTPQPPEDDVTILAIRSAGSVDPHGPGAVYLVKDAVYGPKRWVTNQPALTVYEALVGPVKTLNAYVLDRMEEGPHIDAVASPTEL
jgi:surface antigen